MKTSIQKTLKITTCLALAAWLSLGETRASVTLNFEFGNLYSVNTLTLAPAGGTAVLLASTQNASFGDLTQATGAYTFEADDIVLGIFEITPAGSASGALSGGELDIDVPASGLGLSIGDPMLLVWYPNVAYTGSLSGPGNSQIFGAYRTDSIPAFSDIAFLMPANGTYQLSAITPNYIGGGSVAESAMVANQMTVAVVPEPSSIALVALGCVGALIVRRRKLARS